MATLRRRPGSSTYPTGSSRRGIRTAQGGKISQDAAKDRAHACSLLRAARTRRSSPLVERAAAVDPDVLAGDEVRSRPEQVEKRPDEVVRSRLPAERALGGQQ